MLSIILCAYGLSLWRGIYSSPWPFFLWVVLLLLSYSGYFYNVDFNPLLYTIC